MGNGKAPAGTDLDIWRRSTTARPRASGRRRRTRSDSTPQERTAQARSPEHGRPDRQLRAPRKRGTRVGNGQCFTLVDRALRGAHAHSAADYGTVTPDADYTWGRSVSLSDLQPGDVIQFRDYTFHKVVVTESSSGTTTDELDGERPHHTAVVESVDGHGAVTVLEQNAPEGSAVTRHQLYFTDGSWTSGHQTTTLTVHGTFWFFRPEAR